VNRRGCRVEHVTLCERLRESGNFTPVIMLTALRSPAHRVRGLEAGAGDSLVKLFDLPELLARVRSLLRRRTWATFGSPRAKTGATDLAFGRVQVDFATHRVRVDDRPVKLTRLELDLLHCFASHPDRVLSREELLEQGWLLRDYPNTRTVDNFVFRIRRHREPDPSAPIRFLSVRGSGYRFCPVPAPA